MFNNSYKMRFRCQPELSLSIIYWSITMAIACWGVIFFRENKDVIAWILFLFFLFFAFIGSRRCFYLDDDTLEFFAILPRNRYVVKVKEIKLLSVGKRGLTISFFNNIYQDKIVLMSESTLRLFVKELEDNKNFVGKVLR